MQTSTLLTPVSIIATGGGQDLDVSRLTGPVRVTLATLNTAGTSPTLACKLQKSAGLTRGLEQSTAGANDNKLNSGATTNVNLSLKFTQSGAASLKRVALQLLNLGTITAGKKLTLAIQTDTAGSPSGTVVQNGTAATVLCSAVGASYGWVVFTFTNPPDLSDATVYHLVLSCDYTASSSNCIEWRDLTVASGGTLETYDGTNWAAASSTHSFEVYVDQYSFADVTTGAFTTVTTAGTASVQTLEFNGIKLLPIMRLYSTIGGTSSPAFATAAVVDAQRAFEQ